MEPANRRSASQVLDDRQLTFLEQIEAPLAALLTPDELYASLDARTLAKFSEDRRIERKPAQFPSAGLGQYMSMWANTAPHGGIIVVGVLNDGAFEGLDSQGTARVNDLESAHRTYCPDASVQFRRIAVTNRHGKSDFVLAIRVEYHPTLVVMTNKSKAYIRFGEQCHELSPDEVRELRADKKEISFEREACALEYPGDFDKGAIREFAAKGATDSRVDR